MVASVKPKYTAVARRSGRWWAITVPELDGVFSQARRLDGVERMARDAIELMLEADPASFDIEVVQDLDPPTQDELEDLRAVREAAAALQRRANGRTREFVLDLHRSGYPLRDIAQLIGISHQRVAQLLSAPKT
jgi:predicted RNase H-like HicB family nuclease